MIMTKEEHDKIIDFVNSEDYMLLNSYISKPYEETIIEQDKEIERLKKDLINLLRIIDKNCDDLEGTEEEFDSLDRAEDLLKALKEGKENEKEKN